MSFHVAWGRAGVWIRLRWLNVNASLLHCLAAKGRTLHDGHSGAHVTPP